MSDRFQRNRGREGKSSGGIALNILVFLGGAILILGVIVWFENHRMSDLPSAHHPEDFVEDAPESGAGQTDNDYTARGFQPNQPRATDCVTRPVPVRTPSAPRFIGVVEFKTYRRPDCKTLQYVAESARVPLASAQDAFAKGFIPCKVCQPETPGALTPVKPVKTPDKPVALPIKDVQLTFPFTVVSRDAIVEKGVVRIEFEVDVDRKLEKDEVLLLTQKLVAQEIAKGPINAVSLFVHTSPKSGSLTKWVGSADWAPYGVLSRAGEVKAGDYRNHQFTAGPFGGFFNPKGR